MATVSRSRQCRGGDRQPLAEAGGGSCTGSDCPLKPMAAVGGGVSNDHPQQPVLVSAADNLRGGTCPPVPCPSYKLPMIGTMLRGAGWLEGIIRPICKVAKVFGSQALKLPGPQHSGLAESTGRLFSGNINRSLR